MGGAVQVGVLRRRAALYREEAQEHAGLEKLFREMRVGVQGPMLGFMA
jgi:hypothetical protein